MHDKTKALLIAALLLPAIAVTGNGGGRQRK
ncbi:Uncharacterised protein [Escherichia coli]|jgi:hypothetical protein|uniref:Uncharacterized protein n=1 Tax=Escherichia coli TaxID=562 RepID=A0A376YWZ1_ECOLX|nr:hypothetical protein G857_03133 [Escherichia coli HVH 205 (4-3094677)]GDB89038.1 hypothetical protein HmCmsJML221_02595 [Escherichia coli]STJ20516.1 Uncharacterised protein [Escherichia coli]STK21330.1 Uncharacterised protein [Escherichia coli]STM35811.1 Uncharacterised protein [Escherichia coli]